MASVTQQIADNLARVRERIAAAAARAMRRPEDVRLVAVTKYVSPAVARELVATGCRDLGESRPQELWHKAEALADLDVAWHLIGHLQRNKVRRTLPLVAWVHSVDSPRLADELEVEADRNNRVANVLLEVNVSGDATKHGIAPDAVEALLIHAASCKHLAVRGLMTMARLDGDRSAARQDFARLRQLRDQLLPRCPPAASLAELSMGMSGDFEEAIVEGATMVRVGSALCEGLPSEARL